MKLNQIAWVSGLVIAVITTLPISPARAQYNFARERSQCIAELTANTPGSRITLRSGPSTNYTSLGYGLVGDIVYVLTEDGPPELDYGVDSAGATWYRVGFPGSGASGWIREDFLDMRCEYAD